MCCKVSEKQQVARKDTAAAREDPTVKYTWLLVAMTLLPLGMKAQNVLPSGTIIPVSLDKGINASKAHAGQAIKGVVMQNIPSTPIRRGAEVLGHVVRVTSSKNGPTRLEFTFDSVKMHGKVIPLKANLRALASFMEVQDAQIPEDSPDSGVTPADATTQQIGGDEVYRGGGPVAVGVETVGQPTPYGVLAIPRAQPGQNCRGQIGSNTQSQALWLFSTDACGVYGFSNIRIAHAGRTEPAGTIILATDKGKLSLNSGSGILLRVQGS